MSCNESCNDLLRNKEKDETVSEFKMPAGKVVDCTVCKYGTCVRHVQYKDTRVTL